MTKAVDLQARKELFGKAYQQIDKRIIVCAGTGCIANGSMKIHDKMIDEISAKGLNVDVELHYEKPKDGVLMSKSGCQGFCQVGPLITILPDNIMYCHVKEADVERIVDNRRGSHTRGEL